MHHRSGLSTLGQMFVATALALPLVVHADEAELTRRLEKLSNELEAVKAELAKMKKEREQARAPVAAQQATKPAETPYTNTEAAPGGSDTVLTSYGENNYNPPRKD